MEQSEEITRESREYRQGREAHVSGLCHRHCPYRCGNKKRAGWFTGWLDADIKERYAGLFERNGMTYP